MGAKPPNFGAGGAVLEKFWANFRELLLRIAVKVNFWTYKAILAISVNKKAVKAKLRSKNGVFWRRRRIFINKFSNGFQRIDIIFLKKSPIFAKKSTKFSVPEAPKKTRLSGGGAPR